MSHKKYIDFPAGTYDTAKIFLQADATTGALEKVNLPSAAAYSGTTNRITVTGSVIDISAAYIGQSSITTLGTITTGTWNATAIGPTKGGTGLSAYTTGDILYASATNTLSKLAVSTDGYILTLVGGIPAWAISPSGLPSQAGNSGKYLTTNGSTASWNNITGWLTTGNSGTDGGAANFLGTIDNQDLSIRTNNITRGAFYKTGGLRLTLPYTWPLKILSLAELGTSTDPNIYLSSGPNTWGAGYDIVLGTPSSKNFIVGDNITFNKPVIFNAGFNNNYTYVNFFTGSPNQGLSYALGGSGWYFALKNIYQNTYPFRVDSQGVVLMTGGASGGPSLLTMTSTTQGYRPPVMSTTQKNAIAGPVEGLEVYDLTLHKKCVYTGSAWETITSS